MDSLDLRIFRAMFPGNVMAIHAFDPRLSVQEISRVAGLTRVTIRRRLARWREEGFWRGVTAFPNPDALGTSFQMQAIMLEPGRNRSQSESALIELLQPAFLFQSDDIYNPLFLAEPRDVSERRQSEIRDIEGGHVLCPPIDFPFPSSHNSLRPRDWKIIQSLRSFPGPDWSAVASDVGLTLRSLQRRVARLMERQALFFFPDIDFRRSPGSIAWVGLVIGKGVDATRLENDIVQRFPDLLRMDPVFPFEKVLPPSNRPPTGGRFHFLLPVASASSGDQLRRDFARVSGVIDVVVGFPTQNAAIPRAFDTRIGATIRRLSESDSSVSSRFNA